MELADLKNINVKIRQKISDHLRDENITLNAFCIESKLAQPNLRAYMMNKQSSLSTRTLEKIGDYFEEFDRINKW